jgi:hypothetical protein
MNTIIIILILISTIIVLTEIVRQSISSSSSSVDASLVSIAHLPLRMRLFYWGETALSLMINATPPKLITYSFCLSVQGSVQAYMMWRSTDPGPTVHSTVPGTVQVLLTMNKRFHIQYGTVVVHGSRYMVWYGTSTK